MDAGTGTAAGLYVLLVLLAITVCVLWVLLPFAVFGIKPLMRDVIKQQERTNALLQQLTDARPADSGKPWTEAR